MRNKKPWVRGHATSHGCVLAAAWGDGLVTEDRLSLYAMYLEKEFRSDRGAFKFLLIFYTKPMTFKSGIIKL